MRLPRIARLLLRVWRGRTRLVHLPPVVVYRETPRPHVPSPDEVRRANARAQDAFADNPPSPAASDAAEGMRASALARWRARYLKRRS